MEKKISFKDLLKEENWMDFNKFVSICDELIEEDIKESIKKKQQLREELLSDKEFRKRIRKVSSKDLKWASKELFNSKVCGIDGTLSTYNLPTGIRCRIGVVATSYKNERIERVIYISERKFAEPSKTAIEHFSKLIKNHDLTNILLRSVMLFEERKLALKRKEPWKFVHGPLIPFELRTGRFKRYPDALEVCLDLGKKIIEAKNIIGVISNTQRLNILNAGEILKKGEYFIAISSKEDWEDYIEKSHFKEEDEEMLKEFSKKYASKIQIGVYKVGEKPYLFEAHKDFINKAAALIIQDSIFQPIRGFPMLLDYADSICTKLLASSDFREQIKFKIAKISPNILGSEIEEFETRRR